MSAADARAVFAVDPFLPYDDGSIAKDPEAAVSPLLFFRAVDDDDDNASEVPTKSRRPNQRPPKHLHRIRIDRDGGGCGRGGNGGGVTLKIGQRQRFLSLRISVLHVIAALLLLRSLDVANLRNHDDSKNPLPSASTTSMTLGGPDRSRRRGRNPATDTQNYMLEHAEWLRAEAARMEREDEEQEDDASGFDVANIAHRNAFNDSSGGGGLLPYPVHFVTYASGESWNATMVRLVRQATRSGWFRSATGYRPSDLPPDFAAQYSDVLNETRGAGYWLWRYPVLEMAVNAVPEGEYVFFLDAGCELNKAGKGKLVGYIEVLEEERRHHHQEMRRRGLGGRGGGAEGKEEGRRPEGSAKEMVRFAVNFPEKAWTSAEIFEAFNATRTQWYAKLGGAGGGGEGNATSNRTWPGDTHQLLGGIWIVRNGPAIRRMLALVYDALRPDPTIITDRYGGRRWFPPAKEGERYYFWENRHDQSVSSLAAKVLDNYVLGRRGDLRPGAEGGPEPFRITRLKNITWEKVEELEQREMTETAVW